LRALKEIEFDQATGKLSDTDYAQLKAKYTADAVPAMRGEQGARSTSCLRFLLRAPCSVLLDVRITVPPRAGRRVLLRVWQALRSRPGYCVRCGTPLETDARYCNRCGARVAA
jgi:hypothetical protein